MPITVADQAFMARALRIAELGRYTTRPNPCVGCVIVKQDEIVGEGYHYRAGEGHAEVNALAAAHPEHCVGATAYVTLEPCSHHGKTGPCAEALIKSGVTRVVFAMEDPNPMVAGRGLEMLQQAGIIVDGPVLEDEARTLNRGFIKRMERKRPYVRCKMAMSVDGRTAMASGESKWITCPKSRSDVQRLRAESCAIVTGIGSILADNSSLILRAEELSLPNVEDVLSKQPLRVVVDSHLRLPRDCYLVKHEHPVLVVYATEVPSETLANWPSHVSFMRIANRDGQVDLSKLLIELAVRQCNTVLVEAGPTLGGQFFRKGLLDELIIYMAPKLMGSLARPLFDLPFDTMSSALALKIKDIRAVGQDWRITATPDVEY